MLNLTILQLINFNFFSGNLKKLWNFKALRFLLGFRKELCIFDISLTLMIFRKIFFLIFDVMLKKGEIFFLGSSFLMSSFVRGVLFKIFNFPFDLFFKGGCISNFKEVRKKLLTFRYFWRSPSLFFLFENMYSSLLNFESIFSKIPLVSFADANINLYFGNYTIFGNNRSFVNLFFFYQVFVTLILLIKKRLKLSFLSSIVKKIFSFKNFSKSNKISVNLMFLNYNENSHNFFFCSKFYSVYDRIKNLKSGLNLYFFFKNFRFLRKILYFFFFFFRNFRFNFFNFLILKREFLNIKKNFFYFFFFYFFFKNIYNLKLFIKIRFYNYYKENILPNGAINYCKEKVIGFFSFDKNKDIKYYNKVGSDRYALFLSFEESTFDSFFFLKFFLPKFKVKEFSIASTNLLSFFFFFNFFFFNIRYFRRKYLKLKFSFLKFKGFFYFYTLFSNFILKFFNLNFIIDSSDKNFFEFYFFFKKSLKKFFKKKNYKVKARLNFFFKNFVYHKFLLKKIRSFILSLFFFKFFLNKTKVNKFFKSFFFFERKYDLNFFKKRYNLFFFLIKFFSDFSFFSFFFFKKGSKFLRFLKKKKEITNILQNLLFFDNIDFSFFGLSTEAFDTFFLNKKLTEEGVSLQSLQEVIKWKQNYLLESWQNPKEIIDFFSTFEDVTVDRFFKIFLTKNFILNENVISILFKKKKKKKILNFFKSFNFFKKFNTQTGGKFSNIFFFLKKKYLKIFAKWKFFFNFYKMRLFDQNKLLAEGEDRFYFFFFFFFKKMLFFKKNKKKTFKVISSFL